MVKKGFQVLSFAILISFSTTISAQSQPQLISKSVVESLNKTPNLGFGVSEERTLRSAFMMFHQMKKSKVQFDNYEIVIWSKVVKEIKESKLLFDFITEYMDENITVSVCAVAMDRLGVSIEDLPKGFVVVDNAYVRIFELQALGYNFLIP